jgi:hypothetical protein
MWWVDLVSLGNVAVSPGSTRCRASSMAVGGPAQRAPMTIGSYMGDVRVHIKVLR